MGGLFDGTPLERPVTCEVCHEPLEACTCPRSGDGRVCRPRDQRLVVCRERRGPKVVTAIHGFDPVASDLPALVKELRQRCGAGGTVDGAVVVVQGDHRAVVAGLLAERGYVVKPG